jgi:hypothetical protein
VIKREIDKYNHKMADLAISKGQILENEQKRRPDETIIQYFERLKKLQVLNPDDLKSVMKQLNKECQRDPTLRTVLDKSRTRTAVSRILRGKEDFDLKNIQADLIL